VIVERTQRLHDLVNRYKDTAGAAAEAQKLGNILSSIQASVLALERARPVVQILTDLSLVDREPSLSATRTLVAEAKAATNGSARSYVESEACAALLQALKKTADEMATLAIQGWQDFCTSSQHTLPSDLLAALAVVPDFSETARRAQGAAEKLTSMIAASGAMPTKGQVEAAVRASQALTAALDAIRDSVPPKVQDSLTACMSRDGLPFSQLTDEFREWMRKYKIEKSFALRIR
jgi:hypothetical protein